MSSETDGYCKFPLWRLLCFLSVLSMGNNSTLMSTQNLDAPEDDLADVPMYEEYNALLHGASRKKT